VWTVFGGFTLRGEEAYDAEIENPAFTGRPQLEVVRMVEEGDVIMAELRGEARFADGTPLRMSMAEVLVMRDALICERRAWVIQLKENEYR
jgi:hypothetical protein